MPRVYKKVNDKPTLPRLSNASRISDLESSTSDIDAHIADLEERFLSLKTRSHKHLIKRVSNLESYASDLKAHVALIEVQIKILNKRKLELRPVPHA